MRMVIGLDILEFIKINLLPINLGNDPAYKNNAFKKSINIGADGILSELDASGLQGRGGAAFPAGRKWRSLLDQKKKLDM